MTILKDSIEILVPPKIIFDWLINLPRNYLEWHPDHIKAEWLTPAENIKPGSVLYVEESLHGELHKLKFRLTKIIANNLIEFKISFPMSIISPGGSFIIKPIKGGSIFTATMKFRMGKLLLKFAKKQVEEFRIHMKEEGKNLKAILERKG